MTSKPHSELLARAAREPFGVDISDYSDEWCDGFLKGQVNALEESGLIEQLEALVGVAGGVIWLDNNIHNYGSDAWRGYFKAVLRDARAAYPAKMPS